jgi:hypothetical protein
MADRPLPGVVHRQLAIHKLARFYKTYAPEKVSNVPFVYETYKATMATLFKELLERYPRCPKDYFDDVRPNLALPAEGDDVSLQRSHFGDGSQMPSPLRGSNTPAVSMSSSYASPFTQSLQVERRIDPDTSLAAAMALLARGESLLESTPAFDAVAAANKAAKKAAGAFANNSTSSAEAVPPAGQDKSDAVKSLDYSKFELEEDADGAADAVRREERDLRSIIVENRALIREVALAEQQVLQRRFEVMYLKLVELPASAAQQKKDKDDDRLHLLTICDEHRSQRVFNVQASTEQLQFFMESAVAAPHALSKDDMCVVLVTKYTDCQTSSAERYVAQRNIVAMAMRVWSRKSPFTVTEVKGGAQSQIVDGPSSVIGFHSSTTLWWQWPELCTTLSSQPPEPMLKMLNSTSLTGSATYLPALVSKLESAGENAPRYPVHPQVAKVFTDAPAVPSDPAAAAADGAETVTFWSHFLLQWETLAERISGGKT